MANSKDSNANKLLSSVSDRDFVLAEKHGFLSKKSKSNWRGWHDMFFVLCDIGLLYMSKPSEKEIKIFPYLDFEVV